MQQHFEECLMHMNRIKKVAMIIIMHSDYSL
jgi:hypothetical protein